jgi:hypothetical protein
MPVAGMWRLPLRSVRSDRRSAGMIQQARGSRVHERWAHLRFSVIGQLLAAPPEKGELKAAMIALAAPDFDMPADTDFDFADV